MPLLAVRIFLLFTVYLTSTGSAAGATEKEILAAMEKATDFMMNTVSNRGGFLFHYSADLSKQWGEIPARKSQIWVQPPSTTTVGLMLVEAYQVTGDPLYLKHADKVAGALIWGQHPSGGWHYFIDFDPSGIQKYYEEVASQCRGWEEYYHYYGNATYDDDTTASAVRFLLRLYATTLDAKYRTPLINALNFVLVSQYPNGAWPQRYPLRYDSPYEGHPDYTSFYTFNDNVISNNIYLLLEAYEKLGNEEYRKAARRGMDFYIISQLPTPQAGWAQQYDLEMKPAWARSYEPPSLYSDRTVRNIKDLQSFYMITGDRRYLTPIPEAIKWLESSVLNRDPAKNFTHARLYEVGTNKALAVHHEHRTHSDGRLEILRYWVDHAVERQDSIEFPKVNLEPTIKKEFEEVSALSPKQAVDQYRKGIHRPTQFSGHRSDAKVDAEELKRIISSMDERGAWITHIEFLDTVDFHENSPTKFMGINTATYVSNMYKLINFLREVPDK
jgi:PelA/Pel-15E family pectate lyase